MNRSQAERAVKGSKREREAQRSNAALIPAAERKLMMIYRTRDEDDLPEYAWHEVAKLVGDPQHDRGKLVQLAEKENISIRAVTREGVEVARTKHEWVVGDGSQRFEPGLVYAKHPIRDHVYFPLAEYAEQLFPEKKDVTLRVLRSLGARKVLANDQAGLRYMMKIWVELFERGLEVIERDSGSPRVDRPVEERHESSGRSWTTVQRAPRFRSPPELNDVDTRWISNDRDLRALVDTIRAEARQRFTWYFTVQATLPVHRNQMETMSKDWDIDVGMATGGPTSLKLKAKF